MVLALIPWIGWALALAVPTVLGLLWASIDTTPLGIYAIPLEVTLTLALIF
jgi:hypothetical protein